jgi:catechol 2,3-dioxygenase-like lactoylglutathione lyase family enzyme
MPQLDHLILPVNDRDKSIDFYTRILGLTYERERPPFSVLRVTRDLVLQLAPWGTRGGEHLAFSLTDAEFDDVLRRLREEGVEYGDSFDTVGNMRGPGDADGARGPTKSVYLFDPSRHLIEIIRYDGP